MVAVPEGGEVHGVLLVQSDAGGGAVSRIVVDDTSRRKGSVFQKHDIPGIIVGVTRLSEFEWETAGF
jgi:hypothetical protein